MGHSRLKILCLDDNPIIVDVMSALLEELGHQVIGTDNPMHALDILREKPEPIDLLMADIHLSHGIDGRAIAQLAHSSRPDLRVIHFTGDAAAMSAQGDVVVLPKPCTLGMLEAAIVTAFPAPPSRSSVGGASPARWSANDQA